MDVKLHTSGMQKKVKMKHIAHVLPQIKKTFD